MLAQGELKVKAILHNMLSYIDDSIYTYIQKDSMIYHFGREKKDKMKLKLMDGPILRGTSTK